MAFSYNFFNPILKKENTLYLPPYKSMDLQSYSEAKCYYYHCGLLPGRYCETDLFLIMLYSVTTYFRLSPRCVSIFVHFLKGGGGLGKGRGIFPVKSIKFSNPANCEKIQ